MCVDATILLLLSIQAIQNTPGFFSQLLGLVLFSHFLMMLEVFSNARSYLGLGDKERTGMDSPKSCHFFGCQTMVDVYSYDINNE